MDFLSRLIADPRKAIDAASVTRVDELGNGYDDWGNIIAPKLEAPEQTWGEAALGVATAPARLATALAGSLSPYGQDGWQVPPIVSEGVEALTAVGDAYTGKMAPEDVNTRALGMAGFMMGGGGIAANRVPMLAANASKDASVPAIAGALAEEPRYLYHGTKPQNLDSIRQAGLRPNEYGNPLNFHFFQGSANDYRYPVRNDVLDYTAEPGPLLRVREDRLPDGSSVNYPLARTQGTVSPDDIEILLGDEWVRLGQEQIDLERLKAIIRARLRGDQ